MRIRKRAADAPPRALVSSSSSQTRSPHVPPPSSPPSLARAHRSETAAARCVEPSAFEADPKADRETWEAAHFDLLRLSRSGNRQEGETEECGKATGDEKTGKEDGRPEHERGHSVHVVCSTRAAPEREGDQRNTQVEEQKSENPRSVKEDEETAATCKKADGKGWHCKRAAQRGYSLCQHHLDKRRSYASFSGRKKTKKKSMAALQSAKSTAAGTPRQVALSSQERKEGSRKMEERVHSAGPGVSDSFYYYSGFGPWWRKRRSERLVDAVTVADGDLPHTGCAAAATAVEGEVEEVGDQYDYDTAGGEGRPLKSKALSSLL